MDHNVEIKAKVSNIDRVREASERIAHSGPTIIEQEDTFFNCTHGRLKLRKLSVNNGELIYYQRSEVRGPRPCYYIICSVSEPENLRKILSQLFTIRGIVKKERTLYVVDRTRIHLDNVQGLGKFVELEYVLFPGQNNTEGIKYIESLMESLGISKDNLINESYIDMLEKKTV